jgi:hypothetical protein
VLQCLLGDAALCPRRAGVVSGGYGGVAATAVAVVAVDIAEAVVADAAVLIIVAAGAFIFAVAVVGEGRLVRCLGGLLLLTAPQLFEAH